MEIAEFKRRQVEGIVQVRSQALYEGGKRRIDQVRIEELAEQRWPPQVNSIRRCATFASWLARHLPSIARRPAGCRRWANCLC